MADYGSDWKEHQARLLAAHIARTAARLDALADRYAELRTLLMPGTGTPAPDWGMPAPHHAGPRAPLRVEVLDTLAEIDRYLAGLLPLVRGTLRLGPGAGSWSRDIKAGADRSERARAGLVFMAASLAGVYAEDPGLGDDVSRGAWQLERRAGWIFGDRSRPFALAEPCAECGIPALWVVPERMVIRCGNPACGAVRPVDTALPVHTTETGRKYGKQTG